MPRLKTSTLVDRLGQLQAEIAKLQSKEEALKEEIKARGVDRVEGRKFKATVCRYEQTYTDYAGLIEKLKPSQRLIRSYSYTNEIESVRVRPIRKSLARSR